jgi:predicted O-methyltransferase YrrM
VTCKAHQIAKSFGYLTEREVDALRKHAADFFLPPLIINIGAGAGTSALAFAYESPDSKIYTIDKSPGGPLGGLDGEKNAFDGTGLPLPTQILGLSAELGQAWDKHEKADIIFIDGNHHAEYVRADILAWHPHLKDGCLMIFHDYGAPEWPDVKVVADDWMERLGYSLVEVIDTVAVFEKQLPTPVSVLP